MPAQDAGPSDPGAATATSGGPAGAGARLSAWAPLREPVFRALWIAALASNVGLWMQNVGAVWLMGDLTSSPLLVSLVQTAASLPVVFLALPAGAVADVADTRRHLLVTQTWMLAMAALLALLTLLGLTTPWVLLTLTFLLGAGQAANGPAWQAMIPDLVPRGQVSDAVALNSVQFNVGRAAGPALGGLVVAVAGPEAVFALNALSFLGVLWVLLRWRREPDEGVGVGERVLGAIGAGTRYVRNAPALRAVLARTALFIGAGSALWALLPVVARDGLHLDATGYGVLLAMFGGGSIVGAAVLPRLRQRFSVDQRIAASSLAFAASMMVLAVVPSLAANLVGLAVAGFAWLSVLTSMNIATRANVPGWVQGRALSVYLGVFQGGMAAGSAVWGMLAGRTSSTAALLAAGVLLALSPLAARRWPLKASGTWDLRPSVRPEPAITATPRPDDGPVLVQVVYRIDPADEEVFARTMRGMRRIRRRDGAVRWGLWGDLSEPGRYVETFVAPSWAEHLRQHERFTMADLVIRDRAHAYLREGTKPEVTHLVHPDAARARQRRWVPWTRRERRMRQAAAKAR